jgi:methyl-accepting chemotaxis protein
MFQMSSRSIKTKIAWSVGIFSSAVLLAIVSFSTIKMRHDALENAEKLALAESHEYAKQIQIELEQAIISDRSMCQAIASVKSNPSSTIDRQGVNAILKDVLTRFPHFLGTYTVWEPNAFDGKDSSFANTSGHDKTGRLIPYWYRNGNEIVMEPIQGYESEQSAAWYFMPKKTGQETIMDPFYYQGMYMISVLHPIVKENTFLGITGTDMSMEFIQQLLDKFDLYDGAASISILSDSKTVVTASNRPSLAGKSISEAFPNIEKQLSSTEEQSVSESDTIRTFVPFELGESGKKWTVYIQVPEKVLLASSNRMLTILLILTFVSIGLLVVGIYYFSTKLTKPILTISQLASEIAVGKLDNKVSINDTSEEVAMLKQSFEQIAQGQEDITNVCKRISEGDFSVKATIRSEADVLSMSVNKMIDNLQTASSEDKKRNWASEGLTLFADLLRTETELSRLSNTIISKLVKYIDAKQGGLFILNDDDRNNPHIEMVACYAYERTKYLSKKIEMGEGLVGQCFLEKETIFITDVPANYVNITSGLGEANPRCLLVVPMKRDDEVLGVIEIASFTVYEDYQIKFVERLAESIASAMYNIKINERTRMLLESSQMQSEEMRAQEEEMRQNMEELQATQEEMQRKEQEYLGQIVELKQMLEKVE